MAKGTYSHPTPHPSHVSANASPSTALLTTGNDVPLPGIKGGDVPKKITFSGIISFNAPGDVTIICERDGTQVGQSFMAGDTVVGGLRTVPVTLHWVDETPGKGLPIYNINLVASIDDVMVLVNYTLTAENL